MRLLVNIGNSSNQVSAGLFLEKLNRSTYDIRSFELPKTRLTTSSNGAFWLNWRLRNSTIAQNSVLPTMN